MTTRNWLADAHTALAGADDRVAVSEARVTVLLADQVGQAELPQRWTLDRARLPKPVAAKLARRDSEGLPVPLHAHGASEIAASTPEEWARSRRVHETRARLHSWVPGEPVPQAPQQGRPLDRMLTARQRDALQDQLPHTAQTADAAPPDGAMVAGRVLDAAYFGGSAGLVGAMFALATVALVCIGVVEGTAGLLVAGIISSLPAAVFLVAHFRGEGRMGLDLQARDWKALEAATVAEPGPEPGTPEHRLAQIAVAVSEQITVCQAWSSDDLAVHRIQLDPVAEAAQITAHAAEISRVRATLGAVPVGDSDAALQAREQRAGTEKILDSVTVSLTCRVAALYRYAAELHALSADYVALESVERSLAASGQLEALIRPGPRNSRISSGQDQCGGVIGVPGVVA